MFHLTESKRASLSSLLLHIYYMSNYFNLFLLSISHLYLHQSFIVFLVIICLFSNSFIRLLFYLHLYTLFPVFLSVVLLTSLTLNLSDCHFVLALSFGLSIFLFVCLSKQCQCVWACQQYQSEISILDLFRIAGTLLFSSFTFTFTFRPEKKKKTISSIFHSDLMAISRARYFYCYKRDINRFGLVTSYFKGTSLCIAQKDNIILSCKFVFKTY